MLRYINAVFIYRNHKRRDNYYSTSASAAYDVDMIDLAQRIILYSRTQQYLVFASHYGVFENWSNIFTYLLTKVWEFGASNTFGLVLTNICISTIWGFYILHTALNFRA